MWAAGGSRRQVPADATASQLGKASGSPLPLLPGDGAQPPPDPFFKRAQHRRRLAEAEVAAPPDEVDGQLLDDLREASSTRVAEAQELADARLGNRTLGLVNLQPEALCKESFDADHHPLARTLTAHIDVAVVGVAHEAMTALLQFLVQHIQHQVRQ